MVLTSFAGAQIAEGIFLDALFSEAQKSEKESGFMGTSERRLKEGN